MSFKKTEKNPYKNSTIEEVMQVEIGSYYIQMGENMFESETGKLAFSKERAEHFFSVVMKGLRQMRDSGSEEEKGNAFECLLNFRIIPLRFH